MRSPDHPINVVIYCDSGKADNYDCAGPQQLKEWLNNGRVKPQTQVFARRIDKWMTVESYLGWADRKSDTEQLHDMDATLTNLCGIAEELKRLTALAEEKERHDRQRNERKHRETKRPNGNANNHNDDNCPAILGPVARANSY